MSQVFSILIIVGGGLGTFLLGIRKAHGENARIDCRNRDRFRGGDRE